MRLAPVVKGTFVSIYVEEVFQNGDFTFSSTTHVTVIGAHLTTCAVVIDETEYDVK
jgi:hypothetical protein